MKCSIVRNVAASALLTVGLSSSVFAAEVEFLRAFDISMSRYGMTWRTESYQVAVDDISSDQQVYIHRELEDGSWIDIPMYFDGNAGQNKEVWRVSSNAEGLGDKFVVKMVANGVEYWDNNNGANYDLDYGYTIGNVSEVVVTGVGAYANEDGLMDVYVPIVLDNIGFDKQVEVVYSNDNWASATVVQAQYDGSRPIIGYGSYPNPSASGAESWTANFTIDPSTKHEFFVKYTVNGQEHYANNYGRNYTINYDSSFESMNVRSSLSAWSEGSPMRLIDDNLWVGNISTSGGSVEYKFDVYNDWLINFGDDNVDGIANPGGANIVLPVVPGNYRIYFNDSTNEYNVINHSIE